MDWMRPASIDKPVPREYGVASHEPHEPVAR
jgi:hypothetical protein